ncbi:hypothetical protein KQI42_01265 [Tissierella sp. MSJ-40]|uniref:Tetratricopeptide repeat protein n=1 Tax=Tissierella simiarum TaxID=2841534 RepID=A0ABS6E2X6_9FIRM|nr:hypothetical protein [Tissierella simiarum]MBU5436614.1 hypothetical protein [Tissierella simiarum]
MKRIRLKVKTLILISTGILFTIFIIIPFINLEIANGLSRNNPSKAIRFYENYLAMPIRMREDEALYNASKNLTLDLQKYNIMMKARGWGSPIDKNSMMKAIEYNERIIKEFPKGEYYTKAYNKILDLYISIEEVEKLKEWIEWGKAIDNKEINYISNMYEAFYYFVDRDFEKAQDILNKYSNKEEIIDYKYYFLKGHIAFAKEEYDEANRYYEKANNEGWIHGDTLFGSPIPSGRSNWAKKEIEPYIGENKIKGRVTMNGKGMPFVEVYIQDTNAGYSSSGINFVAITDLNGEYETIGLKEGKYEMGIGINSSLLYDKVFLEKSQNNIGVYGNMEFDFEFASPFKILKPEGTELIEGSKFTVEWEEVSGVDYYMIQTISSSRGIRFSIPDENKISKIKGNKATFDLEVLRFMGGGIFYFEEDMIIAHESIIENIYSGKEIPIIVNGYDKEGNLLCSSLPVSSYYDNISSVRVPKKKLTEGEKLILSKKYDRAIEYYEKVLIDDENNIEALMYLSKLYMIGWKKDMKDLDKAIEYSFKTYELTGNDAILTKLINSMYIGDKAVYKNTVEKIFEIIPEEEMTEELLLERGEYYKAIGDLKKAREDFEIIKEDYMNTEIIYIDLYFGEFQKALDRLKDEEFRFSYVSKEQLEKGIEGLLEIDIESEEYIKFKNLLQMILKGEGTYEENRESFKDIYYSTKVPAIKILLEEIEAANHW